MCLVFSLLADLAEKGQKKIIFFILPENCCLGRDAELHLLVSEILETSRLGSSARETANRTVNWGALSMVLIKSSSGHLPWKPVAKVENERVMQSATWAK